MWGRDEEIPLYKPILRNSKIFLKIINLSKSYLKTVPKVLCLNRTAENYLDRVRLFHPHCKVNTNATGC